MSAAGYEVIRPGWIITMTYDNATLLKDSGSMYLGGSSGCWVEWISPGLSVLSLSPSLRFHSCPPLVSKLLNYPWGLRQAEGRLAFVHKTLWIGLRRRWRHLPLAHLFLFEPVMNTEGAPPPRHSDEETLYLSVLCRLWKCCWCCDVRLDLEARSPPLVLKFPFLKIVLRPPPPFLPSLIPNSPQ